MTELAGEPASADHAYRQRILDAIDAREVADFSDLEGEQKRVSAEWL